MENAESRVGTGFPGLKKIGAGAGNGPRGRRRAGKDRLPGEAVGGVGECADLSERR